MQPENVTLTKELYLKTNYENVLFQKSWCAPVFTRLNLDTMCTAWETIISLTIYSASRKYIKYKKNGMSTCG